MGIVSGWAGGGARNVKNIARGAMGGGKNLESEGRAGAENREGGKGQTETQIEGRGQRGCKRAVGREGGSEEEEEKEGFVSSSRQCPNHVLLAGKLPNRRAKNDLAARNPAPCHSTEKRLTTPNSHFARTGPTTTRQRPTKRLARNRSAASVAPRARRRPVGHNAGPTRLTDATQKQQAKTCLHPRKHCSAFRAERRSHTRRTRAETTGAG